MVVVVVCGLVALIATGPPEDCGGADRGSRSRPSAPWPALRAGRCARFPGVLGNAWGLQRRRFCRMGHQFHRRGRPTWFGRQAHLVFVHGAFADASGFAASIQDLQHAGYPVLAPANPLRGLVNDADSIRTFLSTIAGPIVLVGHSHGGAVITNAATGNPNVTALVYVAAYASTRAKASTTPTASAADTPTCWPTSTSVRSPASTRHRPRRATWTPTSDWDHSGRSSPPTFPTRPRP